MKQYVFRITRQTKSDRPRTRSGQCESYMFSVLSEREPHGGLQRTFDIDWSAPVRRDTIETPRNQPGNAEFYQHQGSRLRERLPQGTWSRYEDEELSRDPDHRLRAIADVALDWAKRRAREAEHEARDLDLHGIREARVP